MLAYEELKSLRSITDLDFDHQNKNEEGVL